MDRNVLILGQSPLAEALAALIGTAGLVVHRPPAWPDTREDLDAIFTDRDRREHYLRHLGEAYREADVVIEAEASEWMDPELPERTLILTAALGHSAAEAAADIHARHRVVGFAALPPIQKGQAVELAATPWTEARALDQAGEFFRNVGLEPAMVPDGPGLVFPRILCLIINEAAFALMEGVASVEDIDTAMKLGTNYPLGPLEWADRIGLDQVLGVLEGLQAEYGEDRYRAAPLLRQLVRAGHLGRATGRGFYTYTQQ
ncbi:MAG: 3-hydroxybutyryl-CoA dehydrogenase [candidate division NC10 bacterium]|nr:3-hydroxybutyryl-CoA dehydrogenase [candidate division NC10 bacterium]MBI2113626.1 3-hydroxybutyryl-CoA dehydrogenase [candidate division NC10 bacterium]MBI2457396.1 3-hydroxybutyryl-CoA dehydrogenase [candidate division NC10 bacterium]MBI3087198.1 3-hydroxybutyryl-CoA dehydrogenase [candidate division NC10 bacterium]